MSTTRPRPSMHGDLYYTWLWCGDNTTVNKWFINLPEHHQYRAFYSSFINAANRAWDSARNDGSTLQPLDLDMIVCMLQEHIPAQMLIDTLKKYNKLIGGTKGSWKGKGIIKFDDTPPEMSTIEAAVKELHKKVKSTRAVVVARYVKEEAKGQGENKRKRNSKADTDADDDQMQDVNMEDADAMPSLKEMDTELTAAGSAPASSKEDTKGKGKAPVKFGELPYVGGKKDEGQEKKHDEDDEWKNFFLK
ncbi:hypothetical protein M436DRAFT_61226 [Aureobasidium namibiae CBS 147.97]|uniref:Uncharacterized protein n=1 Tax=Aureobasidium namibiae CBS 147.97 TaxID=1043004 RepID=A0A074WRZ6_9PEZI